jgi:hypothetical protein
MSATFIAAATETQPTGFTQVPNAILKNNQLSLGARMLYSILLSYCWNKNYCFPSYATLMADMHCHSQALSSYIKELMTHGLIAVERHNKGSTNRYILTQRVTTETPKPEQPPAAVGEHDPSSLKIKELVLRKSKTEEYEPNTYEERFPSNVRIAETEETDYVNCHNPEQESEEVLKPEGSKGEAGQPSNMSNHRNIETIETKKIPLPAKLKSSQSIHVPHTARTTSEDTAIQTAIQGYIRDAACKLHDEAPLKSSTTRAYNLYLRSGIQLNSFFDLLYDAEQETQRRSATITKLTEHGFKNRMAYFFAVLEDRLGLRGQESSRLISGSG